MSRQIIRPWVGPRPYREEDADRFFGREREIGRLQSSILAQRLTLLLAGSGVGKTSLLQAGVLPYLRTLRELEPAAIGPVILVRQWGKAEHPEDAFVQAIRDELGRVRQRSPGPESELGRDLNLLSAVAPPDFADLGGSVVDYRAGEQRQDARYRMLDAAVGYVERLTAPVGKLVLIVDQAEELLGSGLERRDPGREQRALNLFAAIFRRVQQCRLVLSMREEYRARLSPLRRDVADLDSRTLLVEPLPRATVSRAIREAAERVPGIRLAGPAGEHGEDGDPDEASGSILDTVFKWMQEGDGESLAKTESVDLLRLQALLVEIFEYALEETRFAGEEGEEILIDGELLERFRTGLIREAARELKTGALGQQALERYLDRALARQESKLTDSPTGLIRRLVVRMAPWMSSPAGFKRHNREADLVLAAIRGDLDVLRVSTDTDGIREALRAYGSSRKDGGGFAVAYEAGRPTETVSGWGWGRSKEAVGERLARAGFEALTILEEEEILKSSKGAQGTVYELIHDGFGPALHEWAERRLKDIGDTLASIVSQRGESFSWQPRVIERRELVHVRWLGCSLSGFELTGVAFRECDLRGTIFLGCRFKDCRFVDCDLDGLVFQGGSWEDVRWEACDGQSVLFAGMIWRGTVGFADTTIENTSARGVSLEGALEARNCTLRFSQIQSMGVGNKGGVISLRECDVTNALIEDFDAAERVKCLGETTVLKHYRVSRFGRRKRANPGAGSKRRG